MNYFRLDTPKEKRDHFVLMDGGEEIQICHGGIVWYNGNNMALSRLVV